MFWKERIWRRQCVTRVVIKRAIEYYVVDRKVFTTKEADRMRRVGEKERVGEAQSKTGDHLLYMRSGVWGYLNRPWGL